MNENKKLLCFLCFEKLRNEITSENQDLVLRKFSNFDKLCKMPIFVSWFVNGEIRGNVGCFEDIPIINGINEYSITAAMKDWRYSPISRGEFCNLKCTVSILQNYVKASDLNDWKIGTHGIRIFIDGFTATLFPNEMDKEKTKSEIIYQLLRMTGFSEEIDDQIINKTQIIKFNVFQISADWKEYIQFIDESQNNSFRE